MCRRVLGHDYEAALWGDLMGRESTGLAELPIGGDGARTLEKMDSPSKIGMFLVTSIHVLILIRWAPPLQPTLCIFCFPFSVFRFSSQVFFQADILILFIL